MKTKNTKYFPEHGLKIVYSVEDKFYDVVSTGSNKYHYHTTHNDKADFEDLLDHYQGILDMQTAYDNKDIVFGFKVISKILAGWK